MRLSARLVGSAAVATLSLGVYGALGAAATRPVPARVPFAQALPPAAALPLSSVGAASRTANLPVPDVRVAPLVALRPPDLSVRLPRSLTAAQGRALHAIPGIQGLTVLDLGTVRLGGSPVGIAGVDPSQFREFTPRETATSDPLWQSVARGELASTYGAARTRHLNLGQPAPLAAGPSQSAPRLGALAVFGLPGIDLVASHATAVGLGVSDRTGVLLDAPGRDIDALRRDVLAVLGPQAHIVVLRQPTLRVGWVRPHTYRDLYIASARLCPGLSWQVLAAIGQVESGHGRNVGPSSAGALGPMQFLPSTWAYYGVDGDGDGRADIMNPYDAVPAAALYLCRNGAGQGGQALYDAVFSYNHADWYVRLVLGLAARYR